MGAPLTVPRRAFTVDEFHKMGEAGILREDDRIELIAGELIQMSPIGGHHMQLVNLLSEMLVLQLGPSAVVSTQNPVSLPPDNEPQPDIAILAPICRRRREVPTASDVLLLIEVAYTTQDYDRDVKLPIYARHGIAEVWLVDAEDETLAIYLDPSPKGYRRLVTPSSNETVSPSRLPNVSIRLADLW